MSPLPGSPPSSFYLAVDPGKATGYAYFRDGRLVSCGLTNGDDPWFPLYAETLVIEHPHEGDSKASKKDLMTLSRRMQNCILFAKAKEVVEVIPQRWKGNVPKTVKTPMGITHPALEKTWRKLSVEERERFTGCVGKLAKSVQHNVLDACGIGMYFGELKGYRTALAQGAA